MDFLEIQNLLGYQDIEDYHELWIVEKQVPVRQMRLCVLDLKDGILGEAQLEISEHESVYGNGGHIPPDGLSHTALLDKGIKTHTEIDSAISHFAEHQGNAAIHFEQTAIDHYNIVHRGTNTHSTIDNHLSNTSIHVSTPTWVPLTLVNGWAGLSGYGIPQYCKDSMGFIHLRGVLHGASATNTTISTLPSGFRPSSTLLFPGLFAYGNNVVFLSDGGTLSVDVVCTWLSLDTVPPFIGV